MHPGYAVGPPTVAGPSSRSHVDERDRAELTASSPTFIPSPPIRPLILSHKSHTTVRLSDFRTVCPTGIKSRWQPPLLPTGAAQRQSSPVVTRVTNSFPILLTCKLASTDLLERPPRSSIRVFSRSQRSGCPLVGGHPTSAQTSSFRLLAHRLCSKRNLVDRPGS